MPDAFFTGQKGPDAIKKLNQLWAAFMGGATGGTGGATADLTTLNAAVSAASTSATGAASSATTASNAAAAVQTSATSASTSAGAAATSATSASTSASGAATSATTASAAIPAAAAAAASATNAATSATTAGTSATTAGTSATNSATSAAASGTSATNAAASAAAAAISAGTPPPAAAPAAPTGLAASGQTVAGMTLTWNASATATGYNVYRDGAKLTVTPQAALSFTASGLTASTQYTWIVRAVNAAGESANATVVASTTGAALPVAPTQLAASAPTASGMTLTWNGVAGATGYNVYRSAVKVTAVPVTLLQFQDTGLTASTSYAWTVRAVNSVGEGPASASVSAVTSGASVNGLTPLGTRILAGYFESYNAQYNITACPLTYGLVFLFNAQPWAPGITGPYRDDIGDGTFTLPNVGEAQISAASIQAVRARGQKVVVSFGGANANFNFNTRSRSDNFIASVKTILASIQIPANGAAPGADGIDLNMFEAYVRNLSVSNPASTSGYAGELLYICQQLRAFYGANFIITMPPSPDTFRTPNFAPLDGLLAKTLSDNGLLTVTSPQYYEYDGFKVANVIKNYHVQWVSLLSGRQQEVGIGMGNSQTFDTPTLAENQRELAAVLLLYPNTRMVFGWNIQNDLNTGSVFSAALAQQLGVGTVTPPAQPPATPPTAGGDLALTNAFAFEGGKNGAWLDFAPANLRQGLTKASAPVTTNGQGFGRVVDRTANDNDIASAAGIGTLGTYRFMAGKHDGLFNTGFSSTTGGGSGEGQTFWGFALSGVFEPQGYYNVVWSDQSSAFTGRTLKYDSDENGFVFSVGTGTTRVSLIIGGLGTLYVAPPEFARWQVDVWHDGTALSMRVDRGAVVTAACPVFALGSPNYGISGVFLDPGQESGGHTYYCAHMFSPLTAALRDGMSALVATKKP